MENLKIDLGLLVLTLTFNLTCKAVADDSIILSAEEAQAVVRHQCSRSVPQDVTDFWVPTDKEVKKLEENFKKCVNAKDVIDLTKFKRQYAGFLRKSAKFIYVNAAKKDSAPLTARAMIVCDGGADFFGFEYNVATPAFSEFKFNGQGGPNPAGYDSHSFTCPKK
ncbi:MAG: hypothetical protein K2P92_03645 [Bdellovibrionaceae bacterium]|nr:hypothetical protein [Pseudobdellovibrionaceae bacterium]